MAAMEIPIPAGMSDDDIRGMREEIALHLLQCGYLSFREAAGWLGMEYEAFHHLASQRGAAELEYDSDAVSRELARLAGARS